MKVKIFSISGGYIKPLPQTTLSLENQINTWLARNPDITVKSIEQSSFNGGDTEPSKTIISVWYD